MSRFRDRPCRFPPRRLRFGNGRTVPSPCSPPFPPFVLIESDKWSHGGAASLGNQDRPVLLPCESPDQGQALVSCPEEPTEAVQRGFQQRLGCLLRQPFSWLLYAF